MVHSFRVLDLSLPINGTNDLEISIKGLDTGALTEKLRDWHLGGLVANGDEDQIELSEMDDENRAADFHMGFPKYIDY